MRNHVLLESFLQKCFEERRKLWLPIAPVARPFFSQLAAEGHAFAPDATVDCAFDLVAFESGAAGDATETD